jgi:hypothetical protein
MKSVESKCSDGIRRNSVDNGLLQIESISSQGKSELLEKLPLTKLSDEYRIQKTGSYLTKKIMFIAMCPMSLLILFPVLATSSHVETLYFFSIFGIWFFSWIVFGARSDVLFHLYTKDGNGVVQIKGSGKDHDKLQAFVREIIECVRQRSSLEDNQRWN